MVANHVAVPPTPYYYGLRAEWFRKEADKALRNNSLERYYEFFNKYLEYEELAGQIQLYYNNTQEG